MCGVFFALSNAYHHPHRRPNPPLQGRTDRSCPCMAVADGGGGVKRVYLFEGFEKRTVHFGIIKIGFEGTVFL